MSKTVNRDVTEMIFTEVARELTDRGFDYVETVGRRANNGYTFSYGAEFIEVWDNTELKRTPNIAIRPKKSLKGKLPLKTWEKKYGKAIKVDEREGSKSARNEKTIRIQCNTIEVVAVVLFRCMDEITKLRVRGEKENAKKETVKKDGAEVVAA